MNKLKFCKIIFLVLIISLLSISSFKIFTIYKRSIYHHNRMLEYDFLRKIINRSKLKIESLKNIGGEIYHNDKKIYLIIKPEKILENSYFKKNQYTYKATDFYGYEFLFDKNMDFQGAYLYKP